MRVLFVSSGNSNSGISPIVMIQGNTLINSGINIEYFPITGKRTIGYLKSIRKLRKHLSFNKYDIIHAHYGLSAIVSLIARKKEKLIVSFMGDDLIGSNLTDGSMTLFSKWVVLLNIFLARHFYDFSIVKSEEMKNILALHRKAALVPNGVDLNEYYWNPQGEARVITGCGPVEKLAVFISDPKRSEKNFRLAVNAVNLVKGQKIKLLPVIGTDHSELINYYNAADVLLLTSFHEGSPNVIKEAMACNCPIVATDVGDVRWVIGSTEGCYISSFDPAEFAGKIELAIDFREKYGQTNGRKRIIELGLDSENIAKTIVSIYEELIGNMKPRNIKANKM
jgi:teichuronic acid biosynthesis glycosyltransferase TuaC